jgi:uncharacterized membrane protein YgdD (TMEM256/DUF423 family)
VANRDKRRRGRSRKRRPAAAAGVATELGDSPPAQLEKQRPAPAKRRSAESKRPARVTHSAWGGSTLGERPPAPWHPFPLSEILIFIGAIGIAVSVVGGLPVSSAPLLLASIVAVLLGTLEVTLREHMSGYRSHTLILTLLPVFVFHSLVIVIIVLVAGSAPRWVNIAVLLPDIVLGTVLFKLLRARFLDARRERMFSGGV